MKIEDRMSDEMMDDAADKKSKSKKFLTMEDVSNELEKDLSEEIDDSKRYLCMAKVAYKSECYEDCEYLMEIAHDEYTHAKYIMHYMDSHGIEVPEEHKEKFEKLENELRDRF